MFPKRRLRFFTSAKFRLWEFDAPDASSDDFLYAVHENQFTYRQLDGLSTIGENTAMTAFELHHQNCFDWLNKQAANSIEAVCTDPPFGIVEFLPHEVEKMRRGKGGVWRLPPSIGGSKRAPLPRFTTLDDKDLAHVYHYFKQFGECLFPVLTPGGHIFLAGTPMLQHLVQRGMAEAGFEVRGAVMRLYRGFRGGDRPKLAEKEFFDVCVTPRGAYEPWMLFREALIESILDSIRARKVKMRFPPCSKINDLRH